MYQILHRATCALIAIFSISNMAGARRIEMVPVDFYEQHAPDVVFEEKEYRAADGARLSYAHYRPAAGTADVAVVYLHGIESHVGWFEGPARLMAEDGFDVYCLDRRGSGRNQREKGLEPGHIRSFEQLFSDLDRFLSTLGARHKKVFLAGSSWGGKLALGYALANPNDTRFDGLILITPGLRSHIDLSVSKKIGILTSSALRPETLFDVPIPTRLFTSNDRNLGLIAKDPLRLHQVSARFYFESRKLDGFIDKRIKQNRRPIFLILAGQDRIIDNDGVLRVMAPTNGLLDVLFYQEQTHVVQLDAPEQLAEDMLTWIRKRSS